jgi:hypothetical protein
LEQQDFPVKNIHFLFRSGLVVGIAQAEIAVVLLLCRLRELRFAASNTVTVFITVVVVDSLPIIMKTPYPNCVRLSAWSNLFQQFRQIEKS